MTREETLRAQLHLALCDPMDCSTPVRCLWNFPGKNAGMGFHFLLQLIFPTGIETEIPESPALAGRFFSTEPPGKPNIIYQRFARCLQVVSV